MTGLKIKYFVLKPGGKDLHAKASREAMRTYALIMDRENPQFARELRDWADHEWAKSHGEALNNDQSDD